LVGIAWGGERASALDRGAIAEHEIDQPLKCSRWWTAFDHEIVDRHDPLPLIAVWIFGLLLDVKSAVVTLDECPRRSARLADVANKDLPFHPNLAQDSQCG
jgi:hypothetical protein